MRAQIVRQIGLLAPGSRALESVDLPLPEPATGEIRLRIAVCGVCHTELDEIEGRTPPPSLPVVPGHEVIGYVDQLGAGVGTHRLGDRLGVGWIHSSNGARDENLHDSFMATGRDVNGGYAEYMVVPEDYAYPIPPAFTDAEAAPLLCAGGVGYRALRLTELRNGQSLGLTGFGGSAHIVMQLVHHLYPDSPVYVFARDEGTREFARTLGATWVGDARSQAPALLDAIIDTTPAWQPMLDALMNLKPGGRLVVNAIRKEDGDRGCMAEIDYRAHLWMEKQIKTVANVTQHDLREFLPLAAAAKIRPTVQTYPLEQANQALLDLKFEPVRGAKVLVVQSVPNGYLDVPSTREAIR